VRSLGRPVYWGIVELISCRRAYRASLQQDRKNLSHVLMMIDGVEMVNRFIDHLQVVTTNNHTTIADFHTKSSQSTFTSLYLVTALNRGYSSAVF
jgi:hypothetical protein